MDGESWIGAELDRLHRAGRRRFLRTVMSAPTGRVVLDGREVITLGSNNYLGLSTHPKVIEAAANAVQVYGTGASGSRLLTGNCQLYTNLEAKIAEVKGAEAALVFSSGYLANIGAIPALARDEDLILSDALNHASIIDGCRLSKAKTQIYRHRDIDHLKFLLSQSATFRRRLIVTDGVFSMDGNIAPLPEIYGLAERFNAMVMVDEAHSFGVLGKTGGGTVEHFGLENRDIIQMGTLSKAIGGLGGYVAGGRMLIGLLINRARSFIFSTGLPPATLAAASAAIDVMRSTPELRRRLFSNIRQLATAMSEAGFRCLSTETQILPLILGSAKTTAKFADMLLDHGVYAPAIRPPTVPEGTGRLRISVMATHTTADLNAAIDAFNAAHLTDSCQSSSS
ncbi:MAG: 8-amino-7-oxononanoate synthase [Candidatus Poribacteria bacterium]|nr:8-amino-7-oxononanoate synthase [Candidatus Poribacteria bacterium]